MQNYHCIRCAPNFEANLWGGGVKKVRLVPQTFRLLPLYVDICAVRLLLALQCVLSINYKSHKVLAPQTELFASVG